MRGSGAAGGGATADELLTPAPDAKSATVRERVCATGFGAANSAAAVSVATFLHEDNNITIPITASTLRIRVSSVALLDARSAANATGA
jgi:hypothetical protein